MDLKRAIFGWGRAVRRMIDGDELRGPRVLRRDGKRPRRIRGTLRDRSHQHHVEVVVEIIAEIDATGRDSRDVRTGAGDIDRRGNHHQEQDREQQREDECRSPPTRHQTLCLGGSRRVRVASIVNIMARGTERQALCQTGEQRIKCQVVKVFPCLDTILECGNGWGTSRPVLGKRLSHLARAGNSFRANAVRLPEELRRSDDRGSPGTARPGDPRPPLLDRSDSTRRGGPIAHSGF